MNRLSVSIPAHRRYARCGRLAGVECVVAGPPKGVASGLGLGLSGGELQALALGAGFCNQLQFSAGALGLTITSLSIDVELKVDELVAGATIRVAVDVARLLEMPPRTRRPSTPSPAAFRVTNRGE